MRLDVGGNTARASAVFVSTSTLAGVYRDDETVTKRCIRSTRRTVTSEAFRRGGHADLSLEQLADRLAIKELVAADAYCADRRDAAGQMGQFTL